MRIFIIIFATSLLMACASFDPYSQASSDKVIGTWHSKNGSFTEKNRDGFDECDFLADKTFLCSTYSPQSCIAIEYTGRWDKTSGEVVLSHDKDATAKPIIVGISDDTLVIKRSARVTHYVRMKDAP